MSGSPSKADLWLRVRPGADGALALGLAHVMISRGWYDREFVREWTNAPHLVRSDTGRLLRAADLAEGGDAGHFVAWDGLAGQPVAYDPATGRYGAPVEHLALEGEAMVATKQGMLPCRPVFAHYAELCARYTPERVAEICWIAPDQVEAAARLIWHSRPVSYYAWSGHEHHANTTETARAMALLYALTGSFDQRGGNVLFPAVPNPAITGEDLPAARRMAPAVGVEKRPLGPAKWNNVSAHDFYRAVLESEPYPMRGLVGFGSNLLLAFSDPLRGRRALAALDFYVHADLFMNPTAELADIVLPVASCFEREALRFGFEISAEAQSLVQLRQPVVPPPGEARSDTDIIFDLAVRLGLGEHFWNGDVEAAYRHQLAPERAEPGGPARRAEGHPRAAHDPLRQARRAGRGGQCARLRHALAQGRVLVRDPAVERLCADAGICAATGSAGGSLPACADLRQADAVLPDPAPRAAESAPARDGSGGHAASGDRGAARHRGRRLGKRRDASRRDAGASAAQRQYRSARGRGRAWLVASGPRGQCAGL